ncbi:MAG: sigma-70 family RNA polymerase sigma factor [Labilithrix sp.]|nr:sigma-70 family RNA polymerase sigma factor [Labilithrix sp.]
MAAFGYPAPAPAIPASPALVAAGAVDGGAAVTVTAPAVTTSAGVFREHGAFVFRLLRRLGVPDADLDDLTQEVFLIVHRCLDRYEERSQMRAWLYRICVREASRHRRKLPAPALNVDVELLSGPSGSSPEEAAQASEARADFDRLLGVLDEDRRAVFVLYEVEELSMEEVATAVGCPVPTAYSRLRSARQLVVAAARRLEAHREHVENKVTGKGRSR